MIRKKILVVDDEMDALQLIKLILVKQGYEVIIDLNGDLAESIQSDIPNLIILDITLAGKDGRDICQKLKTEYKTKFIPILFISANKNLPSIAAQFGADYLNKPFKSKDLLRSIKKSLTAA